MSIACRFPESPIAASTLNRPAHSPMGQTHGGAGTYIMDGWFIMTTYGDIYLSPGPSGGPQIKLPLSYQAPKKSSRSKVPLFI
jgi:hypothetical protein